MQAIVSILVTAYNHAPYIAEALDSFLMQKTDFPFEVIIHDDASTDGTARIIREYAERYPEIIVPFYQEKNLFSQGIVIYDQVFFPVARGKYFASIEGDDYWCDENKLQLQVDYMEAHPECACCVHNTVIHSCDGSAPDRLYIADVHGDRDLDFRTVMLGMGRAYHTSSLLARREWMIDPPKFYYTAYSYGFGDQPRAVWFLLNGGVHFIDRPMSVYRVRSNPESWSANLDRHYSQLKRFVLGELAMIRDLLPFVEGENREITEDIQKLREFELMFVEGRVREQFRKPYRKYLLQQSFGFKLKWLCKLLFPRLYSLYRKKRGYADY